MGCDAMGRSPVDLAGIFQSTHPHGVRPKRAAHAHRLRHFNPRTRMGCDSPRKSYQCHCWYFNPRTRMGCDQCLRACETTKRRFQSTHPHGVRRRAGRKNRDMSDFNPRTRMGCDRVVPFIRCRKGISIHAPAWGATLCWATMFLTLTFQSTHPHGVRRKNRKLRLK